jgi:beta-fructofuranosidase
MWECPDFFPLGNKHVLLISTMGKVRWKVGTYAHQRFTPEKEGVVDWGSYYAAKTMLDAGGRRILWGWIPEARPDADLIAAGWAGAMSLPRVLSLSSQNDLQTEVAPDVGKLRTDQSGNIDAVRIKNLAAEIDVHLHPKADEFKLCLYSEAGDFVTISYSRQSGSHELRINTIAAPLAVAPGSPVRLHLFVDGSVLEIFANETVALTARVYQIPSGPLRLKLDGDVKIASLHAWQIRPISKDRLTGPLCS